jgi:sec-independent protein translocase protein TatB
LIAHDLARKPVPAFRDHALGVDLSMFGLNWGEVLVIGIVALIAIGPKELPTVLRTLGQWMGKVRRMANEFQSQFNEALREAEFADLKKHADDISTSVSELGQIDPIGDVQKDVEHAFADTPALDGPVEPAAGTTTEAAAVSDALPQAELPPPEQPVAIAHEDAAAEPPAEEPAKEPAKQAGGGA